MSWLKKFSYAVFTGLAAGAALALIVYLEAAEYREAVWQRFYNSAYELLASSGASPEEAARQAAEYANSMWSSAVSSAAATAFHAALKTYAAVGIIVAVLWDWLTRKMPWYAVGPAVGTAVVALLWTIAAPPTLDVYAAAKAAVHLSASTLMAWLYHRSDN